MCKFSMVTRSQQQAAWPGLRNSGTNTRKQAACSGSCVGQRSLPYPSLPTATHSCSTCAPCIIAAGTAGAGLMIFYLFLDLRVLCWHISVIRSTGYQVNHQLPSMLLENASYPSATGEFVSCVPRLSDHFFHLQAEELAPSTQLQEGTMSSSWQEGTAIPYMAKQAFHSEHSTPHQGQEVPNLCHGYSQGQNFQPEQTFAQINS